MTPTAIEPGSCIVWDDPFGNRRTGVVLVPIVTYHDERRVLVHMVGASTSSGGRIAAVRPTEIVESVAYGENEELRHFAAAFGDVIASAVFKGRVDAVIDGLLRD